MYPRICRGLLIGIAIVFMKVQDFLSRRDTTGIARNIGMSLVQIFSPGSFLVFIAYALCLQ